nr:MAG TPA: hypothetical protein [Caudoviricetes sp.]
MVTAKDIRVRSNKIQYKTILFKSVDIYISAFFVCRKPRDSRVVQ